MLFVVSCYFSFFFFFVILTIFFFLLVLVLLSPSVSCAGPVRSPVRTSSTLRAPCSGRRTSCPWLASGGSERVSQPKGWRSKGTRWWWGGTLYYDWDDKTQKTTAETIQNQKPKTKKNNTDPVYINKKTKKHPLFFIPLPRSEGETTLLCSVAREQLLVTAGSTKKKENGGKKEEEEPKTATTKDDEWTTRWMKRGRVMRKKKRSRRGEKKKDSSDWEYTVLSYGIILACTLPYLYGIGRARIAH